MEILRFLEGIRTPFLDSFFSFITSFGEETVFMILGIIIFWCINKKEGYYLFTIFFAGTILNQFLKIVFRIPRPWVKDKNFTIVESARQEATGYSFPSGHTQASVGLFGGIARWNNNLLIRIICIVLCVLVPISRMYLGVHTPLDVGISIIIALILIFGLYPIVNRAMESRKCMRIMFSLIVLFSLVLLLYAYFNKFPQNIDLDNLNSCRKNAFKMLGSAVGIFLVFEIDEKYVKFPTNAVWWAQILKVILGIIPILAVKEGLKGVLASALGENLGGGIRYFFIIIVAGILWPLTFKYFSKFGKKE